MDLDFSSIKPTDLLLLRPRRYKARNAEGSMFTVTSAVWVLVNEVALSSDMESILAMVVSLNPEYTSYKGLGIEIFPNDILDHKSLDPGSEELLFKDLIPGTPDGERAAEYITRTLEGKLLI